MYCTGESEACGVHWLTSWYREHEAPQFCIFYLMHIIHEYLMASNAVQ